MGGGGRRNVAPFLVFIFALFCHFLHFLLFFPLLFFSRVGQSCALVLCFFFGGHRYEAPRSRNFREPNVHWSTRGNIFRLFFTIFLVTPYRRTFKRQKFTRRWRSRRGPIGETARARRPSSPFSPLTCTKNVRRFRCNFFRGHWRPGRRPPEWFYGANPNISAFFLRA